MQLLGQRVGTFLRLLIHIYPSWLPEWWCHFIPAVYEKAKLWQSVLKSLLQHLRLLQSWTIPILLVTVHRSPTKHSGGLLSGHSWAERILTRMSDRWHILEFLTELRPSAAHTMEESFLFSLAPGMGPCVLMAPFKLVFWRGHWFFRVCALDIFGTWISIVGISGSCGTFGESGLRGLARNVASQYFPPCSSLYPYTLPPPPAGRVPDIF